MKDAKETALSQIDITILKMMNSGFSHQEIAFSFEYSLRKYYNFYIKLLKKTRCWDDVELCEWWHKNKKLYPSS